MTGILLLLVAILWLAFVIWFCKTVTRKLPIDTWRVPVALLIFVVMLPLPLIDGIFGALQFERLCNQYSAIQVNRKTAVGRTLYFDPQQDIQIQNSAIFKSLAGKLIINPKGASRCVTFNLQEMDLPMTEQFHVVLRETLGERAFA